MSVSNHEKTQLNLYEQKIVMTTNLNVYSICFVVAYLLKHPLFDWECKKCENKLVFVFSHTVVELETELCWETSTLGNLGQVLLQDSQQHIDGQVWIMRPL